MISIVITPLPLRYLAPQVTLDGVLHSINEAGTALPTQRWYGSEAIVDAWLEPTLAELSRSG
jgi:hypothetical protein